MSARTGAIVTANPAAPRAARASRSPSRTARASRALSAKQCCATSACPTRSLRVAEGQQQRGALWVRDVELGQSALEKRGRVLVGELADRSFGRAQDDLGDPIGLDQRMRIEQVTREVGQSRLASAGGQTLDRLRDSAMQERAARCRQAAQHRLADERVSEVVSPGRWLVLDESRRGSLVQRGRRMVLAKRPRRDDIFEPERLSGDGRGGDRLAHRIGEPDQAAIDHRPHRVGDPAARRRNELLGRGRRLRLSQVANGLLHEERVAARSPVEQFPQRGRRPGPKPRRHQLTDLAGRESRPTPAHPAARCVAGRPATCPTVARISRYSTRNEAMTSSGTDATVRVTCASIKRVA